MKEDNTSTKDFWLLVNEEHVTLSKQKRGKPLEWSVEIPKEDFDELLDWYLENRKLIN